MGVIGREGEREGGIRRKRTVAFKYVVFEKCVCVLWERKAVFNERIIASVNVSPLFSIENSACGRLLKSLK